MRMLVGRAQEQATILVGLVAVLWLVEIVDLLPRTPIDWLGIHPRELGGLVGIFFAPFLHGGFGHLLANTAPLVVLGWLIMLRGIGTFFAVTLIAMLLGGFGVWLFGRPGTIHIGASGVIFGYLGYLILRGYFERSFGSILLAILVGFLYGGALWGVLPGQRGISWEAHLFGFLAGAVAARLLATRRAYRARY